MERLTAFTKQTFGFLQVVWARRVFSESFIPFNHMFTLKSTHVLLFFSVVGYIAAEAEQSADVYMSAGNTSLLVSLCRQEERGWRRWFRSDWFLSIGTLLLLDPLQHPGARWNSVWSRNLGLRLHTCVLSLGKEDREQRCIVTENIYFVTVLKYL